MEYQKTTNLFAKQLIMYLDLLLKKWIEIHDQSDNAEDRYKPSKKIRFKTSMLRSGLCDFSDTYIAVKGTITVKNPDNDAYEKKLDFKNKATFLSCFSKINNTIIDNAEDLDIVIPM